MVTALQITCAKVCFRTVQPKINSTQLMTYVFHLDYAARQNPSINGQGQKASQSEVGDETATNVFFLLICQVA